MLVEVGRGSFIGLRKFSLVQNLIDCLAKFVEFVAVLLILEFQGDDHLLVVFLAFPLIVHQLLGLILPLHQFYYIAHTSPYANLHRLIFKIFLKS